MENSKAWRGKAGKTDAKSATDADHSGGCLPRGGGANAGFRGPAEGVLKISASKIFDQWLTAGTHEGSHAGACVSVSVCACGSTAILQWATMRLNSIGPFSDSGGRTRWWKSGYIYEDAWPLTHSLSHLEHAHTHSRTHTQWAAATETQTGYSPHPFGAHPTLPCILANVWEPLTQSWQAQSRGLCMLTTANMNLEHINQHKVTETVTDKWNGNVLLT